MEKICSSIDSFTNLALQLLTGKDIVVCMFFVMLVISDLNAGHIFEMKMHKHQSKTNVYIHPKHMMTKLLMK